MTKKAEVIMMMAIMKKKMTIFPEYHLLAFKNIAKFSLITRHTSGNTQRGFVQKIKSKLEKWRYAFKIYKFYQPRIFFFTYKSSDIFIALHIFLTSVNFSKKYMPTCRYCLYSNTCKY